MDTFFVDAFLDSFDSSPDEIVLDLDATDDPLHGAQEGRFFHGYYRCYCYLPLYVFCGDHLLCARLRRSGLQFAFRFSWSTACSSEDAGEGRARLLGAEKKRVDREKAAER